MPIEHIDRIILSASLKKILKGQNIEGSVSDAEKVLRNYANIADDVQNYLRTRPESEYLKDQLDFSDLEHVGDFRGSISKKKDYKIYSFQIGVQTVEFYFKRGNVDLPSTVVKLVKEGDRYHGDDLEKAVARTLLSSVAEGKTKHHSEVMLGKESRTLDIYELERVEVVESVPRTLLGFIPWFSKQKRNVVYRNSAES